jgi:hypothetical protein
MTAVLLLHAASVQAAKPPVEVRAYVNDTCIVADEPYYLSQPPGGSTAKALPLVGIVVGKLVELLLRHAVKATAGKISSSAERKDTRYAVVRQTNLFRVDLDPAPQLNLNSKLGCMTIVAGKFQGDEVDCTANYVPRELAADTVSLPQSQWRTSRTDDSLANPLRRANVCTDGEPKSVYESRFEFSEDGTAYRLRNAGYRVNSLLTTDKPESRSVFYTLEISQPARDASNEVLSTAWVNLGTVTAGERVIEPGGEPGKWLRVPPMSVEARRSYEQQTRVHQSVSAEIEALERAMVRNRRMLGGLEERMQGASAEVANGLKEQALKTEVQVQTLAAELDARRAEYGDLPHAPLEFMPVSIEVGVTEKTSEKRALLALAQVIDSGSGEIASVATSGLIQRSIDTAPSDPGDRLEAARADYFDAKIALKQEDTPVARQKLAQATEKYQAARTALGLGPAE